MKSLIKPVKNYLSLVCFAFYLGSANCNDITSGQSIDLAESTLSLSLQPAINSIAILEQIGSYNLATSFQAGFDNYTDIRQLGDFNQVNAIQHGESNILNITQYGDNNSADVYQFGSNNTANIQQSGHQYFLLEQHGDHAVVNVIQF